MKYFKTVFFLSILVLSGCVGPQYFVRVDSIRDEQAATPTTYIFLPTDKTVSVNDLYFRRYAGECEKVLQKKGFQLASTLESANTVVLLSYGAGKPETVTTTYTTPVYDDLGGNYATVKRVEESPQGTKTTYETVYVQPQWRVIGQETHKVTKTLYESHVVLEAVQSQKGRPVEPLKPLWKTVIKVKGPTDDLRELFPFLMSAAEPYISTDTGHEITLEMRPQKKARNQ